MLDHLKAVFLVATGTGGTLIAALKGWQENIEWSLRILLLVVSIASVIAGLVIACRRRPPPPNPPEAFDP